MYVEQQSDVWFFSSTEAHSSNTICSLTVSGEKMPPMTTEMQLQVSLQFQKYLRFLFNLEPMYMYTQ